MYRGDTQVFDVVVTDDAGVPVSIASDDIRFTAKRKASDDDADAVIVKTSAVSGGIVIGGGTGACAITIDPSDTDALAKDTTLLWDLQVTDVTGAVKTAAAGRLHILVDISRTAP
jgi:hypothetical protein